MKNCFAALSTTVLISVAPLALAASGTELTVTGFITPSACTPGLSTANIHYGKIPANSLNQTELNPLPQVNLQLTVDCLEKTSMALRLIDNNPTLGTSLLSLGVTPANEPIGGVMFTFSNPIVDTAPVAMSKSKIIGDTWYSTLYFEPGYLHAPSVPGNPESLISSQRFTTDMTVRGFINPARGLTLAEEVPLDGNATIQIEYL